VNEVVLTVPTEIVLPVPGMEFWSGALAMYVLVGTAITAYELYRDGGLGRWKYLLAPFGMVFLPWWYWEISRQARIHREEGDR